jgi:DNA segregation ATPase FtsK/SpoIIIE, S-DNA-T family
MKVSSKLNIAAGTLLLLLAAFFSIALILQPLDFGTFSPGRNNFLFRLGSILISVYGFCSILIPVFLLTAAYCCFAEHLSTRTIKRLLTAVIPFFTAVITENICTSIAATGNNKLTGIKIAIALVISGLLIAIEIAGAGIITNHFTGKRKTGELLRKQKADSAIDPAEIYEAAPAEAAPAEAVPAEQEQATSFSIITEEEFAALTAADTPPSENEDEQLPSLVLPEQQNADKAVQEAKTAEEKAETVLSEQASYAAELDDVYNNSGNTETLDAGNLPAEDPEQAEQSEAVDLTANAKDTSLDPDFFDIDMNALTDEEAADKQENEPDPESFALAKDVFAAMDADIRKNIAPDEASSIAEDDEKPSVTGETTETNQTNTPLVVPAIKKEEKKTKFKGKYKIPITLLTEYQDDKYWIIDDETKNASVQLKETLNEFNIEADIIGIKKGPVVTMFEILPAPGVKLSKIAALQDNIALRLAASSVRIVAPIPGKRAVGIEIPNKNRSIVSFREIIEMDLPEFTKMAVPVILGKDILGKPQLLDLVKTPHMLIAGATGSGKSVCVNSMILSILYKRSPNEVKLILIDPKIVELKLYNDIPHLLTPVITEPKRAFQALQYCLCEMERRYALLDGLGVRDISNYNRRIEERHIATEKLPYIVVIIDEFADLMATTGKELESTVARLAAMSRAVGIHLVLATQRPSIDVITGLIKANIPSRIAFMVASKMDSRIIIDQVGAEKLLGRGDMLYSSAVDPFPVRIQGTFVSDSEVEDVVEYVKQYGAPEYIDDEIFIDDNDDETEGPRLFDDGEDPLYNQALEIIIQAGKASASYIQRRLKIGYNRAARLVEEMEDRGIVGPANGSKPREIIHVP